MTDLADFARIAAGDLHLCVVATARADGTVQASLVNAGVMPHPAPASGGIDAAVFVARGGARKLANLFDDLVEKFPKETVATVTKYVQNTGQVPFADVKADIKQMLALGRAQP